ncbi:MAG: DUF5615 family PIN-like protein [Verrucomicrobiaceae bacterium]|nr:DUF5615 family PIN-like protein [Verrucomicrobiaceae bacterium]
MAALLLDSCVWGGALTSLTELGHDAVWTGSWENDPGDLAILTAANAEHRILITLDKDFGELAIVKGLPHCGIIRLAGFRAKQMAAVIHHVVSVYQSELEAGAIATVSPERIRIRTA